MIGEQCGQAEPRRLPLLLSPQAEALGLTSILLQEQKSQQCSGQPQYARQALDWS